VIAIIGEPGDEVSGSEIESLVAEAKSSKPSETPKKKESDPIPKEQTSNSSLEVPKSEPTPAPTRKEEPQKSPGSSKPKDVIFASPIAKKLALEQGIPLSKVKGSGPGGRIIKSDIESYKPSAAGGVSASAPSTSGPAYTDIPLSNMRRVIGQRLKQSKIEIPNFYLTSEINVDKILKLREVFNAAAKAKEGGKDGVKGDTKLSVNDFIVKGAALALKDVPEVNSGWFEDFIRQ
jgi:pyruvate dehydrogenase E2 component (dihydrolipoamide acetyltransferase)